MNANGAKIKTELSAAKPVDGKQFTAIVLIGVSGILISFSLYWILSWEERRLIREEFEHRAADRMMSIASEFEASVGLVRSVSAHVQMKSHVSRDDFHEFTKHLFSPDTTIHALSWNTSVPADKLRKHVLAIRQWYPDYQLKEMRPDGTMVEVDLERKPAEPRDFVVVDLIEPLDANRSALGFDIASEPARREALNRARDTGELAATRGIRLVQEQGTQFGVLIFGPIYERDFEINSVQQRRNHFKGVVVGICRIGDTVDAALNTLGPVDVDVYVFDGNSSSNRQLLHLHSSRSPRKDTTLAVDLDKLKEHEFYASSTIEIGGRQWTLCCTPTVDYVDSRKSWLPFTALGAGLFGTLLLATYISKLARLTAQLQHHLVQREQAEQTLKKTQQSIDSSHIPILWVGSDGRFRYVNAAAAESLGYERRELCKMGVANIVPGWSAEKWADRWEQLKKPGSAILESVHQRKDGTTFPVEIMVNYFSYAEDEYLCCQTLDITERNRQQDRLRERERELAHISRLSTLGEMVAGIAHEINQPLSAISNFAGACHMGLTSSNYEFTLPLEKWTQQIGDQAVRCGDIIRRLRSFVKKSEIEPARVNVNEIVDDSIALIKNDAGSRSIRINWNAVEPGPIVDADRVQLQQVIVNLLRNAYESISESDATNREVLVHSQVSRGAVQLTVEDHGHGIHKEHLGKVFDAFFTTKPDGMGMGLAISRSIVEAHGGRLWAESAGSRGARFHVELPASEKASHGI